MIKQLPLKIQLRDDATFANFFVGFNHELLHVLQKTLSATPAELIYLWGPMGAGRSHLLQAACHEATEKNFSAMYLSLAQTNQLSPQLLENLEHLHVICLDDIEAINKQSHWQEALFHCYNRAMATNTKLIVAANVAPQNLNLQLKDLNSRLTAGVTFRVTPLTDEQKLAALQYRAKLRGMNLAKPVARFLLTHYSRDMNALFNALEKLDQASLIAKKKPTIELVKETLKK